MESIMLGSFIMLVAVVGVPLWQIAGALQQIANALHCECEEEPTDANPSN